MKKVNKIFSIFIIILLICFMISTPVFAVDLSDTTRYNQFSQGSKDKAAENAINDMLSLAGLDLDSVIENQTKNETNNISVSEEDFKKSLGMNADATSLEISQKAYTLATTMKKAISESTYYLMVRTIEEDKTLNANGTSYSIMDYIRIKDSDKKTYKEMYESYPTLLVSSEKKNSNEKVKWNLVQASKMAYNRLTSLEATFKTESETLSQDDGELKNLEWTEIMKKYSTAPTLIEQGKISVVKSWLKTLEKVVDDPLAYNMKDSGYDLEQVRSAVNYLKDLVSKAEDGSTVYKAPKKTSQAETSEASIGDVINDGDVFVNSGNASEAYDATQLQNFSKTIYNILLVAGILVATAMGGILGIKLMISSVEEKAEVKKLLVPYVVGCVVVFGGFGIWKLVVTILERI